MLVDFWSPESGMCSRPDAGLIDEFRVKLESASKGLLREVLDTPRKVRA